MHDAVAVVQSYLRINGFLTVTEYPIIHRRSKDTFKEITDIDVLAVRLPQAGRVLPRPRPSVGQKLRNDPALDIEWRRAELLIAEVKEGVAKLNEAMFRPTVVREALRRFGACDRDELDGVVDALIAHGTAELQDGTRVRLMAFASKAPTRRTRVPFSFIPLSDVLAYLDAYIEAHWKVQSAAPFRDPVLRFLAMLKKTDREQG